MPPYTAIIRALSAEKFTEIFAASARQARESYLRRHKVTSPPTRGMPRPGERLQAGSTALHRQLGRVEDDALCQQMLRSWLLQQRPLLAAALDHLGIAHQEGLTDSEDVERIATLDEVQQQQLLAALLPHGDALDARIYLAFMGATGPLLADAAADSAHASGPVPG